MAFNKIKPRKVSEDILKEVSEQAKGQTYFSFVPKSEDPDNFPVFTLGNETYLIYVPNHTVENDEGLTELRWDAAWMHTLIDGKQYPKVRCAEGIENHGLGLDGTCPICDSLEVVNDLASKEASKLLVSQGYSENDDSTEARKLTSGIYGDRIMKRKQRSYTFPIVVFERTSTENPKTGRKTYSLVLDEDGNPKYTIMWYSVSDALYFGTDSTAGKWKPELDRRSEEFELDIQTPAGLWFNLKGDYSQDPKAWSARDAARNFSVSMLADGPKGLSASQVKALAKKLDKETLDWTPEKAIEMVIANHFLPVEDVQVEVDRLLQPVKDKLALFDLGSGVVSDKKAISTKAAPKKSDALLDLSDDDIDDLGDEE